MQSANGFVHYLFNWVSEEEHEEEADEDGAPHRAHAKINVVDHRHVDCRGTSAVHVHVDYGSENVGRVDHCANDVHVLVSPHMAKHWAVVKHD